MLETLRRYWIAMLVLVMIGLHASIVGLIRYQASMAKIDASCEVDLGSYLAFQAGRQAPISMRLYAIVPINHRMKSRQLIELNQAQIRQSLEEHLRQIDSRVLTDPYLADLKSQLLDVMVQTIGNSSIDDLVITELHEPKGSVNLEFVSRGAPNTPRQLVATLRAQNGESESEEQDESHGDGDSEDHGESSDHGVDSSHGASPSSGHKASSHAPLKSNSHGAAKSSGHGAAKSTGHGASKSSGHGAAKASSHGSSGHGSSGHGASSSKKPAAKSGH
ncbi:hypothetical protein VN12_26065 [Pirellula sp. SH-Sr6A]|uniref:hypothetical protein n=1 Tax=Pirellula sp. SH-Sr6A TaxID=1632865 RepID=UPI00078DE41B|nr:hypothetical protein [Pirellula sp. SH-Sr6A]AMV35585.1 hypothetical protein VN12_26065 [Pirellula sp. SH-Sr6A]